MSAAAGSHAGRSPYIGPRAFEATDAWRFYGRDREISELQDILIASRIVLLYSPSGAGKTSLLKAALIPRLAAEGFRVPPVIRLNHAPDDPGANRYVRSALLSLEERLPVEQRMSRERLATTDLPRYLDARPDAGDDVELLVFDQFEEILTLGPNDLEAKAEFFRQVGTALRNRRRWAIFAMREDYRAGLDPYSRHIPTGLATIFRLDLLGIDAAMEAIQKPARECGVDFTDAAAEQLVRDLSEGGPYVEPVQLQVVCRRLWSHLPRGMTEISASDAELSSTSVDSALVEYYEESVAAVAASLGIPELAIREWVDAQLVSRQGVRTMVLLEPDQSRGLATGAIQRLVNAHLLRTEERRGATWVELAHDRLVGPVQESNHRWMATNRSPLQREASVWDEQGRPADLLLRGAMLAEAERWAAEHRDEVKRLEREYLEASRAARSAARARVWRWASLGGTVLITALLVLIWWAWTERGQAERQAAVSQVRELAAQAPDQYAVGEDQRGALLAVEAYRHDEETGGATLKQADDALRAVLGQPGIGTTLKHYYAVVAVAFSPDGSILATGSFQEARLWDVATGQPIGEPLPHESTVRAVAFSPDGTTLATGSDTGLVRLWDMEALEAEPVELEHDNRVNVVAFSPDGAMLATGSNDGRVRLWRLSQPRAEPRLLRHVGFVSAVAFSPDGATLATGGENGEVRLWNLEEPEAQPEVLSHETFIFAIAFSPDGATLATAGADGAARLWDVTRSEAPLRVLTHDDWVNDVAFSPDGATLATAGADGAARLWDVDTSQDRGQPLTHDGWVFAVAFSPDGATLATAGEDGAARLWDLTHWLGDPRILSRGDAYIANAVAFSPGGGTLAAGSDTGLVLLWEVASTEVGVVELKHDSVNAVAFSPDGAALASGSNDGTVLLWDLENLEADPVALDAGGAVYAVAFSPDDTVLAIGGESGVVQIWDLGDLEGEPLELPHDDRVNAVGFSPDGGMLATGSFGAAWLWDTTTWEPRGDLLPHDDRVNAVAFSPDGGTLATGSGSGNVGFWNVATGEPRGEPFPHDDRVNAVAFSPDGEMLATGSFGAARLWDATRGEPNGEPLMLPHENWVYSVAFSPDGKTLATGSWPTAVRLWTLDTGALADRVCQIVQRNLSQVEWDRFVRSSDYRKTCPNLPPGVGAPGYEAKATRLPSQLPPVAAATPVPASPVLAIPAPFKNATGLVASPAATPVGG